MTGRIIVTELALAEQAEWSFSSNAPRWRHHQHGSVGTFDPFPCYAHDRDAVDEAVASVSRACPPLWNVELFIADREEVGRSNGYSNVHEGGHYADGEWVKDAPTGLIMLSGKRIPPHPAVTRYLVAHEYGHNVEWMINRTRGVTSLFDDALVREYAGLRALGDEHLHEGSGGRWHNGAHEIMACDFRILVCESEPEFWPHRGVTRPETVDGLYRWWAEQVEAVVDAAKAVAA